jgi:hypothetical protein
LKYLLLIYGDPSAPHPMDEDESKAVMADYYEYTRRIQESGEMLGGEALESVDTATTVRVKDGEIETTDGPFAETKEVLGGFYLVDCQDLDRAIELAAQLPGAKRGRDSIEVRPIWEPPPDPTAAG